MKVYTLWHHGDDNDAPWIVDAVDELNIPDRILYLLDLEGNPVKLGKVDDWIRRAARRAWPGVRPSFAAVSALFSPCSAP